jgi:hypothetical protein
MCQISRIEQDTCCTLPGSRQSRADGEGSAPTDVTAQPLVRSANNDVRRHATARCHHQHAYCPPNNDGMTNGIHCRKPRTGAAIAVTPIPILAFA